jgi:hypothetical protein
MTLPASGPLSLSDIQTEFGGTNPISLSEYYAGGGLVPAGTSGTYGAVPTSGQISVQNFYGTANYIPTYIEELFSTWLFNTNTPSNVTISNGINLSGNGGLVWIKLRSTDASHQLYDTVRGGSNQLQSNRTNAQSSSPTLAVQFGSNGFTWLQSGGWGTNEAVSWTFREQPKFFDIVTYTGNGGSSQTINHNLGSVPGCMIVKSTSAVNNWKVYHRSLGTPAYEYNLNLNTTDARDFSTSRWASDPTSTTFSVASNTDVNASGITYVAYLFAHNAGGFGPTGTDNIISCGSYTGNQSSNGPEITLGYEPQWLMIKSVSDGNWFIIDTMRGFCMGTENELYANLDLAEGSGLNLVNPTATGFKIATAGSSVNASGVSYIYIAIRRGPMKVPTVGTNVFLPQLHSGYGAPLNLTGTAFPVDLVIGNSRVSQSLAGAPGVLVDRLRGKQNLLIWSQTDADNTTSRSIDSFALQNGVRIGGDTAYSFNYPGATYVNWFMGRAPSFFDEVCYTGTGSAQNVAHNLTVAPELIIIKSRSNSGNDSWWAAGSSALPSWGRYLNPNVVDAVNGSNNAGPFNNTAPTSSVFTVNTWTETNGSGRTYVAYLFATCAGVSKVGSYTGTGALLTVNCGFTTGARFVLIKRIDSTGGWFVWNSATGISSGDDPYLALNTTNNEVNGTNYVDTTSVGFQVTAAAPATMNASGGTYLFLAIA